MLKSSPDMELNGCSQQTSTCNGTSRSHLWTAEDPSKLFSIFDENRDGLLDATEFQNFSRQIFKGDPLITEDKINSLMQLIDFNKDGYIDVREFTHTWSHCFQKMLNPVTALLVIDVQNDFIDGSLALSSCPSGQNGEEVVPVINDLINTVHFDHHVFSLDWHPDNHISFAGSQDKFVLHPSCTISCENAKAGDDLIFDIDNVARKQTLWPRHCVQGTRGAELNPTLKVPEGSVIIHKGTNRNIDSYSAFYDNDRLSQTDMQQKLASRNVTDVFICGIATDVCVAATTRDALNIGYRTVLIEDACRGVDLADITKAKCEVADKGALILHSNQAKKLASKENFSIDLALFTVRRLPPMELAKS